MEDITKTAVISIHALREEGDSRKPGLGDKWFISIHALREEGDLGSGAMRGGIRLYFYPRPPRGGRRGLDAIAPGGGEISIHALREEGDAGAAGCGAVSINFYPRPPRGGRQTITS